MKSNRNIKMCGKLQIKLLVAAEVDAWRTLERGALGLDSKENPVDSCNHRKGIILGLTVQNTPNNQSAVIRSGSECQVWELLLLFFIALWGHILILSQVLVQLSAV